MILLSPYEIHMQLTALALVGAQSDVGIFSNMTGSIIKHIGGNSAKSVSFAEAGITIAWETEIAGFPDFQSDLLFSDENISENSFALHFSLTK